MKMTFDEYDELIEKFELMHSPVCWPTKEQINDVFEKEPEKWLLFCCYLYEQSPSVKNTEDKESKQAMLAFINKHLELIDNEDSEELN